MIRALWQKQRMKADTVFEVYQPIWRWKGDNSSTLQLPHSYTCPWEGMGSPRKVWALQMLSLLLPFAPNQTKSHGSQIPSCLLAHRKACKGSPLTSEW